MIMAKLTPEQRTLGELYHWIHRRAEYLRQQKTTLTQPAEPPQESTDAKK